MRKLILIAFLCFACSKDDDGGCKCQGKFSRFETPNSYFYVNGVDCETGQPYLDISSEWEGYQDNPVLFNGCND